MTFKLELPFVPAGDQPRAIEHYRRAIETDSGNWEAHNNLGLALARQDRLAEATAALETALEIRQQDDPALHYNLGNVLLQAGRAEAAVDQYRRALDLDPDDARIHNNLGSAFAALGRRDDALRCYRDALTLDPDHAAARANLDAMDHSP